KAIQRYVVRILGRAVPGHSAAMGFNRGRSTALHVHIHADASALAAVDIRDFFGSVRRDQVWRAFARRPSKTTGVRASPFAGWSNSSIELLTQICVLRNVRGVE